MKKKTSSRLLDRSCQWIRQNWNASNLDVPDELLEQWMYQPHEETDPTGFYLAVFSFGYLQYDLVSHNVPPGAVRSFAAAELLELFHAWQMKLALAQVHRATDLRIKPLPLFAFPKGERIESWEERPPSPHHSPAST